MKNREIKFRYVYPREYDRWEFIVKTIKEIEDGVLSGYEYRDQCTGLKDKNNKEIYESDLLKRENGQIDEVVFFDGSFLVKHGNGDMDYIASRNGFEIVGNRFENPELLFIGEKDMKEAHKHIWVEQTNIPDGGNDIWEECSICGDQRTEYK